MADILKILLIIVGILTIYVSYWLLAEALFPGLVERYQRWGWYWLPQTRPETEPEPSID